MSNEILSISIPQIDEDIDIFEDVKALLVLYGFKYIDMSPEYNSESISYRFQRLDDDKQTVRGRRI